MPREFNGTKQSRKSVISDKTAEWIAEDDDVCGFNVQLKIYLLWSTGLTNFFNSHYNLLSPSLYQKKTGNLSIRLETGD